MGKLLSLASFIIKNWIAVSPVLALAYLVIWIMQIFSKDMYYEFNTYFGHLPRILDFIFPVYSEIKGEEISMGYVYSAGIAILTTVIALKLDKKMDILIRLKKNEALENRVLKMEEKRAKKIKEEKKKAPNPKKIDFYCGLFEIKLEYYNPINKSIEDLEKLKKEYIKMITNKIKDKYPTIKFVSSDKIFMYSVKFKDFNQLVLDLNRLYKIFYDLDYEKSIKTDLLLSFWCDFKKVDIKSAYKIVSRMNNLRYLNKIIVSENFALRYKIEKEIIFDLIPMGMQRLDAIDENSEDIELELYQIKKLS